MARLKLRSPDQPLPVRTLLWLYEACASLRLAVVLIGAAACILGWATFVESRYGTPAVHFGIYDAWWFTALNVLLACSVLCAALIRFPWRKKHMGFLVTHSGILVLLLGCLISRRGGIDAQLPVFEGRAAWRAFENSRHFQLKILPKPGAEKGTRFNLCEAPSGPLGQIKPGPFFGSKTKTITVPFAAGPFNWDDYGSLPWFPWRLARRDRGVVYHHGGIKLEVLDYYSDSKRVPAPQVKLNVEVRQPDSRRAQSLSDDTWQSVTLNVQDIDNPHTPHRRFGIGTREQLPDGTRIVFWMAGSPAETDAFRGSHPKDPLGPQGQLVLYIDGQTFRLPVDRFQKKHRRPLGKTGLEVELIQFTPRFLGVELRVHGKGTEPRRMLLFADAPEFNQQDYHNGLFGSYWFDMAEKIGGNESPSAGERMLRNARRRRIDVIFGSDGKLYYRAWKSPKLDTIDVLPADGTKVVAFQESDNPLAMYVEGLIPSDKPTTVVMPVPFAAKKNAALKECQARVRLGVDGRSEEFWLAGLPADPLDSPLQGEQRKVVEGDSRRVAITMPRDEIDLGFQVFLHKFDRRLDPGTSQASHYSSLVDFLDRHDKKKRLQEDVLITLNAPVDFSNRQGGRSYRLFQESFRGPWRPGDPLFDELVGGDSTRDRLFLSWLTVNYDPGRGLKYAGCLLIVVGIIVMFYMKAYFFQKQPPTKLPNNNP